MQLLLPTLLPLVLLVSLVAAADWNYRYTGENAPSMWPTKFPKYCSGRRQSPINLIESVAVKDSSLSAYGVSMPANLTGEKYYLSNNGKSITLNFMNLPINVSLDSGSGSCYRPLSMHWHWGSVSTQGSEHRMAGRQYPMEGHIVMWNCQFFTSFADAFGAVDGIAVLGVFYEESSGSPTLTSGLSSVASAMTNENVTFCSACNSTTTTNSTDEVNTGVYLDAFDLKELLPTDMSKFFVYLGSLTTPDCTEGLVWTVYKTPVQIPTSLMQAFRSARHEDGVTMSDNYRIVQELNPTSPVGPMRQLSRSFDIEVATQGTAAGAGVAAAAVAAAAVVAAAGMLW